MNETELQLKNKKREPSLILISNFIHGCMLDLTLTSDERT
jgi:hypothetical protein